MKDIQLRPFTGKSFSRCEEVSELTEAMLNVRGVR
jgi:hypothetical protein